MKVVFFQRKPFSHQFSIEKVFEGIRAELSRDTSLTVEVKVMPYHSMGILPRLKNIWWARQHQGDINHITGDVHYIALGLVKRRTILTIHDLNFLNLQNMLVRWLLKFFWLTLPLQRVRAVTVISDATRKDLLGRVRFPANRIRVIPNYYDPSFRAVPKVFNTAQPRILQIGTKANKNVPRLSTALDGISCHLVMVGGESHTLRAELENHHISYTWLQNLTDAQLKEQYALCDMLSFVSIIEGFGMPILEAQATGRVVLTSEISSMPEVAGSGACFVDPLNVSSIRNGLLKLIHDENYRNSLVEKGFINLTRFERSQVAVMYKELYRELSIK